MIPEPQLTKLRELAGRRDEHGKNARTLLEHAGYPVEGEPVKPRVHKTVSRPRPVATAGRIPPRDDAPGVTIPRRALLDPMLVRARLAWRRARAIGRVVYRAGAIVGWLILITWLVSQACR